MCLVYQTYYSPWLDTQQNWTEGKKPYTLDQAKSEVYFFKVSPSLKDTRIYCLVTQHLFCVYKQAKLEQTEIRKTFNEKYYLFDFLNSSRNSSFIIVHEKCSSYVSLKNVFYFRNYILVCARTHEKTSQDATDTIYA